MKLAERPLVEIVAQSCLIPGGDKKKFPVSVVMAESADACA